MLFIRPKLTVPITVYQFLFVPAMFIKIKLEIQDGAADLKNLKPFEIGDWETVLTLKRTLDSHFKAPVERQDIRSIHKKIENHLTLKEICDLNGTIFLYYIYDEKLIREQFVAFLQIFNEDSWKKQLKFVDDFQNQSENNRENSSLLLSKSGPNQSISSTFEDFEYSKKPTKHNVLPFDTKRFLEQQHLKRQFRNFDEYSCYANFTQNIKDSKSSIDLTQSHLNMDNTNNTFRVNVEEISSHAALNINPELRQYVVIIKGKDNDLGPTDTEHLLMWFFGQFRMYDRINQLQFLKCPPIELYEGKIWIACQNQLTYEWIVSKIEQTVLPLQVVPFHDHTSTCKVVIPTFTKSQNLLEVFDMLEKQNVNLITLKWIVRERQELSTEDEVDKERIVCKLCLNEILIIEMDKSSADYLMNVERKLKYCFWEIVFEFL